MVSTALPSGQKWPAGHGYPFSPDLEVGCSLVVPPKQTYPARHGRQRWAMGSSLNVPAGQIRHAVLNADRVAGSVMLRISVPSGQ